VTINKDALGEQYLSFLRTFRRDLPSLPKGIGYLNPYRSDDVMSWSDAFYRKYFSDTNKRILILGINPGRFGGGQTGIPFTDPVVLEEVCGINNDLPKRKELSSTFIYEFIDKYGGANEFYSDFLISSVCPLGFIRDGKNLNFYDDKKLLTKVGGFIRQSFYAHSEMHFSVEKIVVIGKENTRYFERLNEECKRYRSIITLEHPRFILQYRRKQKDEYINKWLEILKGAVV
jgi:hypothetical protein